MNNLKIHIGSGLIFYDFAPANFILYTGDINRERVSFPYMFSQISDNLLYLLVLKPCHPACQTYPWFGTYFENEI